MQTRDTRIDMARGSSAPSRWSRARALLRGSGALDRHPRAAAAFYTAFASDARVYTRCGCTQVQELARGSEPVELWTGYQWAKVRFWECERAHTSYCVYSSGGARVVCGHKQTMGVLSDEGALVLKDAASMSTGDKLLPFSPPSYSGDARAPISAKTAEKLGAGFGLSINTRCAGKPLDAGVFGNSLDVAAAFLYGWSEEQRGHIMGHRDVLSGLVSELAAVGVTRTVVIPAHGKYYELFIKGTPELLAAGGHKLKDKQFMMWSVKTSRADVVWQDGRQRMYRCKILGESDDTPHTLLVDGIVVVAPAECDKHDPGSLPPTPTAVHQQMRTQFQLSPIVEYCVRARGVDESVPIHEMSHSVTVDGFSVSV